MVVSDWIPWCSVLCVWARHIYSIVHTQAAMFQCFTTKNIWPGIFTFSLTLFQYVAKHFETFQSSDLVIFGSVSVCFS